MKNTFNKQSITFGGISRESLLREIKDLIDEAKSIKNQSRKTQTHKCKHTNPKTLEVYRKKLSIT